MPSRETASAARCASLMWYCVCLMAAGKFCCVMASCSSSPWSLRRRKPAGTQMVSVGERPAGRVVGGEEEMEVFQDSQMGMAEKARSW